ncbi:hypothetical protein F4782DRAFT_546106 [Xylaria castorea]|nr:hypothetical protein F4782DRAFT_546106 [Xylaria castorea]
MASLNNPAVLDSSTKELLYELDDLTVPFEELAQAARQCYNERLKSDVRTTARNETRRKERAGTESQLGYIQEQAAHLKQRREAIISRIPPHQLTHARSSADLTEVELDAALLEIEEQKLEGPLIMIKHAYNEIIDTQVDIKSVRDLNTRSELKAALDKFLGALSEFGTAFSHHGAARREVINQELMNLEAHCSGYGRSPISPQSPGLLDDDEVDDSSSSSADATTIASSFMSDLNFGSLTIPVREELGSVRRSMESEDANDGMFRFERNHPPTLSRLANWLGLDDAVSVALLLNTQPIQHAFQAYRAAPTQSCAENPQRLKLILPLFTFPRETLQLWQVHVSQKVEKREEEEDRLDVSAALFANQVVRFLERSCEEVVWERVSGDMANFGDYELTRSRWAIVLQMFWFMEKAFANVN